MVGADAKPPVPTITSGANERTIRIACAVPAARSNRKPGHASDGLDPGYADARTKRIGIPSRGTMSASARPRTPTYKYCVRSSPSARPIASAGLTWPAVPPPVRRMR